MRKPSEQTRKAVQMLEKVASPGLGGWMARPRNDRGMQYLHFRILKTNIKLMKGSHDGYRNADHDHTA